VSWFASHNDVVALQGEVDELGSLVAPSDRARAVAGGCIARVLAAFGGLMGFSFSIGLGFALAESVHWSLGIVAGIGGTIASLVGAVGLTNSVMAMFLRRARRRAIETPTLNAISSSSSAAIPSLDGSRSEPE
jgi:hypothetical protein